MGWQVEDSGVVGLGFMLLGFWWNGLCTNNTTNTVKMYKGRSGSSGRKTWRLQKVQTKGCLLQDVCKSVPPMQTPSIPVLGPSIVQILENTKIDHRRQDGQKENLPKRPHFLNDVIKRVDIVFRCFPLQRLQIGQAKSLLNTVQSTRKKNL